MRVLIVCIIVLQLVGAIRWLGLNLIDQPWTEAQSCPRNKIQRIKFGLVGYQSKMCKRIIDLMPVIIRAAQLTAYTCQQQFADRRWNCSSIQFAPKIKSDLTKGTREQAYVYALSSAAVTHQVAKACVSGDLPYCPCGINPTSSSTDGTYKWKGCSDNVAYGQRVSREWADAAWRKSTQSSDQQRSNNNNNRTRLRDSTSYQTRFYSDMTIMNIDDIMRNVDATPRAKMNQHNNDVGRQVAQQTLDRKCKCHGVSSSCSVRTCWNALPELGVIAEKLKDRYVHAIEVRPTSRPMLQFESVGGGHVSKDSLIYTQKSPDYCIEDRRVGSFGTRSRQCNATSLGEDGCASMCCGRGYTTQQMQVDEQCHCKYVHCCYVKCKQCTYTINKHYCK